MDFAQAAFELPLRKEFGFVPRLGVFSHAIGGRNHIHVKRYCPCEIESYWFANLRNVMDVCWWWTVGPESVDVGRDLDFVCNVAQTASNGGQMPLVFVSTTSAGDTRGMPNAGRLHFDHLPSLN